MLKYIALYLLLTLGLYSCNIKEDLSRCPGTILLDYTAYSDEILDDIKPDEQVHTYIFNRAGICEYIYTFTYEELQKIDYEFNVPKQYNGCYAVVWHGDNSSDYMCRRMKVGESAENFYLRLNYDVANNTFSDVPDPLWASPLEPIDYCASKSRHRIHMTRVHTEINVNLCKVREDGTKLECDMDDYQTSIETQNDVYHTDYTIDPQSDMIVYNNAEELAENTFLDWAHVGTLRITPDAYCMLSLAPVDDLDSPITVAGSTKFDLVDYMLQSREGTRATSAADAEISDQRFLDLNKVWYVELAFNSANIAVYITVNGWTIWLDDVDLN